MLTTEEVGHGSARDVCINSGRLQRRAGPLQHERVMVEVGFGKRIAAHGAVFCGAVSNQRGEGCACVKVLWRMERGVWKERG